MNTQHTTPHRDTSLRIKNAPAKTASDSWLPPIRQFVRYTVAVIVFAMLGVSQLFAQQQVTGTVTDAADGSPLPGVNVIVEGADEAVGSTIGTTTNIDGEYSLNVPANLNNLVFTFVGYERHVVSIDGRNVVDVELAHDLALLEDVIVVGYGVQRQRDISGSVTSLDRENFNTGVALSPEQLVQGRLSGVNIMQNSGKPGASTTIRVRGGTSIAASNEPLFVIDGVPIQTTGSKRQSDPAQVGESRVFDQEPVNPLQSINPDDIESITVLKDASATAIYGSRGANGVIVITTREGVAGAPQFDYSTRIGFSRIRNKLDVLSADEFRQVNQERGLSFQDLGGNVDYQDLVFRTGFSQNHTFNISGGSESTRYRGSFGFTEQEGTLIGSNHENFNIRLNANHTAVQDRLHLDLRLTASQFNDDQVPVSNTVSGESGTNLLWDAYRFNPTMPVRDAEGNFNHIDQFNVNPLSYERDVQDRRETRRFLGNLQTTYELTDQVSAGLNLSHTVQDISRRAFFARRNPIADIFGGMATLIDLKDWSDLLESTVRFEDELELFGATHAIEAVGGYSWQEFTDIGTRLGVSGFLSDEFSFNAIQAADNVEQRSNFRETNRLISWFGRVNYNYSERYIAAFSLRRDGSSRFGAGNKWGWFPSGSVAWRVSEEAFFDSGFINHLQLRGSYGITGNQEIGNLNSIQTLGAISSRFGIGGRGRTIVEPQQFANPDLRWEETSQINLGVNIEFLNSRFEVSADYYKKDTDDLLLSLPVPAPSVVSTQLANIGSVENEGVELEVSALVFQRADFTWRFDGNMSHNRNEVKSLADEFGVEEIRTTTVRGAGLTGERSQIIKPGLGIGTFYGKEFLGFDENGIEIVSDDEKVLGSASPDFSFGFGNSLFFRQWDFRIHFRGMVGNDVMNNTAQNLGSITQIPSNNVLRSTIEAGASGDNIKQFSSRFIEDGSFLRLDNLTLGYTFDVGQFDIFRSARVFATGQNLFVITGYSGHDPEVNSNVGGAPQAALGVDYLSFPRSRTFTVGASIGF